MPPVFAHGELRLYNEYGLGLFGVLHELFDTASPVLLLLFGIGLIGLGTDGRPSTRWWRLGQIALGIATVVAVIALGVHAFSRDRASIVVDNATDAPCVLTVDGTRVGVLAEKTVAGSKLYDLESATDVRGFGPGHRL